MAETEHDVIGGYRLVERKGAGSFGEVYKVDKDGGVFALKRYSLPIQGNVIPDKIREEFAISHQWEHPNLVKTIELGLIENGPNSNPFLVMEYVDGNSLSEIGDALPMEQGRALDIILDAAFGLAEAAEHDVIHRDIKPGNIMLKEDETAVIVDFGMARLLNPEWLHSTVHTPGSASYCSPHQYQYAGQANQGDDIYSLGCVFYYLLTGKHAFWVDPHQEGTMGYLRDKVNAGDYTHLSELNPDIADDVVSLVENAMKCDKSRGHMVYRSWEDFIDDLFGLLPLSHRRRPNTIHPEGLESLRLVGYQSVFHRIYSLLNSTRSTEEVMLRLLAASADLSAQLQEAVEGLTVPAREKVGSELASVFTWLLALADRTGVDLETAVWLKYPSVCTYCHSKHSTEEIEAQCKSQPRPIRPPALLRLAEEYLELRPATLEEWEKQLKEAFPTTFRRGVPFLVSKLTEEIGEVAVALSRPKRRMDLLRRKKIDPLAFEMADLFAWLCHCSHFIGRACGETDGSVLAVEIAKRFRNEVCYVCGWSTCMCEPELMPHGERSYDMQERPGHTAVGELAETET